MTYRVMSDDLGAVVVEATRFSHRSLTDGTVRHCMPPRARGQTEIGLSACTPHGSLHLAGLSQECLDGKQPIVPLYEPSLFIGPRGEGACSILLEYTAVGPILGYGTRDVD